MTRGESIAARAVSGLLLLVVAMSILGCGLLRKNGLEDTVEPAELVETEAAEPVAQPSAAEPPAEAEALPEIEQVSVVDAEPPEPRLLPTEEEKVSASSLANDLGEAERLSDELAGRKLTVEQLAQVESGRGFLDTAREALELRDLERAGVLLEKCLVLLRDAEAHSRT